jgi:quercetin dioxygenase-like cupin family protein
MNLTGSPAGDRQGEQRPMKITHAEESTQGSNAVRGGNRQFKTLLRGDENSPGNYKLSFVRQGGELYVPRHKHNFDQLRMCLEGEPQNYGKDKWIKPGEIVYFPEGTPYGPEDSKSQRLSITLQFGGASGAGYLGAEKIAAAIEQMKAFGSFEKGVFTRDGELKPGEKRNQDSYEAIWEYVNKRKLTYPRPRYEEPVRMKPAGFEWVPTGQNGIAKKLLGAFSERGCTIAMLKLEPGASGRIQPHAACQVLFVVNGEGRAAGEAIRKYTALSLEPDETCEMASAGGMELLLVGLPLIGADAGAIDRAVA